MVEPHQIAIFVGVTALIGLLTYLQIRGKAASDRSSGSDYFLANRGLAWYFVAGSITLTNLSTDQLVGMNGNQMLLLAWWELAAVAGLMILAFVFVPIYYRNNCITTTELLEKKYKDKHIRALISTMFLLGNILIFLPAVLYSGGLFLQSLFGLEIPVFAIAVAIAIVGAAYAIFGGLRAVAVSDTISGILILGLALYVAFAALNAIGFDLSDAPPERLTLIGAPDSPIPWPTLFTGMILIQIFYWSTNQTITQRAMAAPSIREAQRGVLAAAAIRLLIVPVIVTLPGVVAYKLFGDIGDAAYGRIAGEVLPGWASGVFAAAIAAAVLTTFNSILNASATLFVWDLYGAYFREAKNVPRLAGAVSMAMTAIAILLVPLYQQAESIINLLQQLYGLLSMPILSAFAVGLLFRNVEAGAAIIGVLFGIALYAYLSFVWSPVHYIHAMAIVFFASVAMALTSNRILFGGQAAFALGGGRSAEAS